MDRFTDFVFAAVMVIGLLILVLIAAMMVAAVGEVFGWW